MLTDLIYYDLKVAVLVAVFYLFYILLLARETTHMLNRAVLLLGIVLSAVLPLCIITYHRTVVVESDLLPAIDDMVTGNASLLPLAEKRTDWTIPMALILMIGMLVRLSFVAKSYKRLHNLMRSGEIHTLSTGTRLCVVDVPVAPFSWMHTIILSRIDYSFLPSDEYEEASPVLAHEEAHVRHRHSYDVVVVEVLTALQWFNPVVWYLRQELRTLHEYEADASVLSRGFDESQYIHLLMQKAMGIQACTLANGIHTPKTKKRIIMMLKPKSKRTAWLKALYIVPIVLVSLAMTAKTVVDYKTIMPVHHEDTVRMFSEKTNDRGDSYQIRAQSGVKFFRNGKEEQIPQGRSIALEVSKTTMQVNGKPVDQATLLDLSGGALKEIHLTDAGSGKFVCNMVTEPQNGKKIYIVDGEVVTEESVGKLTEEDIANVSVIGNREIIKNTFHVDAEEAIIVQTKKQGDEPVFDICEQLPQFPGGEVELMKFIAQNIKYPAEATKYGVQGRVLVQFVVETDGSLSNCKILENPKKSGANMVIVTAQMTDKQRQDAEGHNAGVQAMRDEAIRVVNAMPKWQPGKQRGRAVRCKFHIPVTYKLN